MRSMLRDFYDCPILAVEFALFHPIGVALTLIIFPALFGIAAWGIANAYL